MKNHLLEYRFLVKKFDISKKSRIKEKIGYLSSNLSLILNGNQGIQTKEFLVEQNLKKAHSILKGSEIAQIHLQASQFKNGVFIMSRFMRFIEIFNSLIKFHGSQLDQNKLVVSKLRFVALLTNGILDNPCLVGLKILVLVTILHQVDLDACILPNKLYIIVCPNHL